MSQTDRGTRVEYVDLKPWQLYSVNDPTAVEVEELEKVKMEIKQREVEPNGRVKLAVGLAKQKIIQLQQGLGLEPVKEEDIHVAFLKNKDYQELLYKLTQQDNTDVEACHIDQLDEVLVDIDGNEPDYILSSFVFHELVHKYIDRKIRAKNSKIDYPSLDIDEPRRAGLNSTAITFEGEQPYPYREYGELLSELGNFILQKEFAEELLMLPDFAQEAEDRRVALEAKEITPGVLWRYYIVTKQGQLPFVMNESNQYAKQDGSVKLGMSSLILQLTDDMQQLLGIEFRDTLLWCKAYPEEQIKLMQLVDAKMGKGFYKQLKNSSYDIEGVVSLAQAIQRKLYPQAFTDQS